MRYDAIILGSGLAGLTAALHAAHQGLKVAVLTKSTLGQGGSSPLAQGGVAVVMGRDDSPELHARDTLVAGAGLCREEVVDVLTREGPERVLEVLALGARLDRNPDGTLALGREAAHGRRRIVHAKDATGAELMRAVSEAVRCHRSITVVERFFAADLIAVRDQVLGVYGPQGLYAAPATVLATGGVGRVYRYTTNARESTGDGIAMAYRAGARLQDLEFVQFHPTALDAGGDPLALVTEAVRGEGGRLMDETGRRFMPALHPDAELAPRDVVARAIWAELAAGRRVFLDATHLGTSFHERFPTVSGLCRERGLDPAVEPMPVVPAAHYFMGGIAVDVEGRTSLRGLWACGEAASNGLHGANRLASNSLLEAMVFGARVGRSLADAPPMRPFVVPDRRPLVQAPEVEARLRQVMWDRAGLVRDEAGLQAALRELEAFRLPAGPSEA
ncbi:MAG: L-aspartate oxidase, partial [Candidatus Eremiobacterota bacterium]